MKRVKHSLSHYKLTSMDMGELVPVSHIEVLPGDSMRFASSALIRVSPLVAPVMHPVTVRLHRFFVPYRLLWDGWEDFITGGSDGLGGSAGAFPTITHTATAGSLADYLGVPVGVAGLSLSALPFRAYAFIYNEMYRDQDLVAKVGFSTASGADVTTNTALQKVAWEKDYFTGARPWTQKGPDVSLPLGVSAPVVSDGTTLVQGRAVTDGTDRAVQVLASDGVSLVGATNAATANFYWGTSTGLEADLSGATAAAVNDIRRAFALQRYAEARAMYGSRYTEYLRYLGVRSSDARLQRPEYIGGGKQTLAFSEVLQTAEGTAPVGTLRGHGIGAVRTRPSQRFFEEHGVVLTLASVRPRAMYTDGLHRSWAKRTKEEYWQRELEAIGQQEIFNQEVYAAAATKLGTFGYGDRYSEYRHHPSDVSGEFRSTLNYWHLARSFAAEPVLNASFVTCEPTKRVHVAQTNDVLWCMFNHSIQARRLVGPARTGRVL